MGQTKRVWSTIAQLRRESERRYGLSFEEALEMAYENATYHAESLRKECVDLRRRLDGIAAILETVDNRAMAADGPVTKTREEITDSEYRKIYRLARPKAHPLQGKE